MNRRVLVVACIGLAILCGFIAFKADAYTRAIESEGVRTRGVVISSYIRPCTFGDLCIRKRRSLTHVGHATVAYQGPAGQQLQTRESINNRTEHKFRRGQRVAVTYPRSDPSNVTVGNLERKARQRWLLKLFCALGALALIGAAFYINELQDHEMSDLTA